MMDASVEQCMFFVESCFVINMYVNMLWYQVVLWNMLWYQTLTNL